jgi:hypothetical protein
VNVRAEQKMQRALGLLVALTVACGAGPLDPSTGIAAEVRRGPISPVDQVGVDNTAPVPGAQVVILSGNYALGQVTTDAAGKATMNVPPGDYQVAVYTCPGAMRAPAPVGTHVASGALTSVRVVCDTGIR